MKRTGQSKIAVVGWGRGMGHKGHMYLADAVITQAKSMGADPYFFVSKTVGKDDPIYPEEKVRIYQKVFPQQATIFTPQGNLNQALEQLAQLGYDGVVVVVGADQKQAFQYLERPGKDGVPIYQKLGFKKLRVISRQETRSQFAREEGPRATPMREILLDPNASEEDKFKVWRRDMPDQLGDNDVLDVMRKAESRLVDMNAPKKSKLKAMSTKAAKLKEALIHFRSIAQPKQEPKKEPEQLGYAHLFKSPEPETKPEQRFHGWDEYEKQHKPGEEVEEGRILDANSKVDLYYVTQTGARQIVFQSIPQRMLDKAIMVLRSKYPQIKDRDIEMRPASHGEYRRTSQPELAEGSNDKLDSGDKITWYYSNQYPELEGEVVGWKDGHLIVKSIDPSPRNTEKTVATYRVPKNNIISVEKQGVAEGWKEKAAAAALAGSLAANPAHGGAVSVAGAIPTPSHQAAMYKAAADSNRAMAAQEVERQRRENAAKAAKLAADTKDVERLNKVNYHGKDAPKPTDAEWDGDSDFLYLDGTQYAKASRMPITGDVPPDIKLISTREGRQVYIWTRNSLTKTKGHYFYPAEKPNTINEFAPGNGDDRPTAEYEVYQCNPQDQFDWIGGPLMQTDDMGKAHSFAYFLWKKHPDKCFMIWQERSQGSRGGYGPKGSVLAPSDEEVSEDKDPCWDGYKQIGMKDKNGRKVPNCVPTNEDYLDE